MGKFNFGIDASSAANADLGDGFYTGDTPPKGNYHGTVKQVKIKLNSSGDHRLNVLVEVAEPEDSDKAQYNGAALWAGLNVIESGRPWINNFLDAIGAKRTDFWDEKITTSPGKIDKDTAQDVLKVGTRKVVGHSVFVTGGPRLWNGGESFEIKRFLDDDGAGSGGSSSSDAEPDADAVGLDDAVAGDDTTAASEGTGEGYTESELDELSKDDLVNICDEWEIKHAASATKATLIKLILKAQDEDGAADEPEPEADETAGEALTEEDLESMDKADLISFMEEKGWDVPSPAIPSRLRKFILEKQAEAPF